MHQRRTAEPARKPEGGNQRRRNLLRIMESVQLKRRQEIGVGAGRADVREEVMENSTWRGVLPECPFPA